MTMLEANVASKGIYIASSSWGFNAYHCGFITKNIQKISSHAKKKQYYNKVF